jgi:hypothetical protein
MLETLLQSADAGQVRASARAASRSLKGADHLYWQLDTDAREAFHAELRAAETQGAVRLTWGKHGGEDRRLERVQVHDIERLAQFLGLASHDATVRRAAEAFAPWLVDAPRLADVLERWRAGRVVRKMGPDGYAAFVDAAKVMAYMGGQVDEQPVRVASRRLFRNSKRIEALIGPLDVLCAETWPPPVNHREHVLARLGLRVSPLPFFLAGRGAVALRTSGLRSLAFEYLAVSPTEVVGFAGDPAWVLCVENLTTFGMAAREMGPTPEGLVLYTGGMPSPSWRRALQKVLSTLPQTPVFHWGDIDEGGFRIAAVIAQSIAPRPLLPWCMDPTDLVDCDPGTALKRERMVQAARAAGWHALAERLGAHRPVLLEQEDLPIVFPHSKQAVLYAEEGQSVP